MVNPSWLNGLYFLGMTFLLGSVIWLLAFISPEIFRVIFQIIGVKSKEADDNLPMKDKNQIKQIALSQEAKSDEESESEKLRKEFKNRKL